MGLTTRRQWIAENTFFFISDVMRNKWNRDLICISVDEWRAYLRKLYVQMEIIYFEAFKHGCKD
jgi:hypothetical protein